MIDAWPGIRFIRLFSLVMLWSGISSQVQAQEYRWKDPISGNFSTAGNWSPNTGPPGSISGTAVLIDVQGAYTVTLDANPAFAITTFTLDYADAIFAANGRTLTVNTSANLNSGTVNWFDSHWNGTGTLTIGSALNFNVQGNSEINAQLANNGFLTINGTSTSATLTIANGFTNSSQAQIFLTSSGTGSASLVVTNGTITNAFEGSINFLAGGSSTLRTLDANLDNAGSVAVDSGLTAALLKTNGIINNSGLFTVGDNAEVIFGDTATFNMTAGSLSNSGSFVLDMDTLNFSGGEIFGNAVLLRSSALNISTNTGGGFLFERTGNTLSGDVADVQSITVRGTEGVNASVTAAVGFTNHGVLNLTSNGSGDATLTVTTGTLTNSSTGTLNLLAGGTSNLRSISADIVNSGVISVTASNALFNKDSASYSNSGVLNIASGGKLTITGGGSISFTNQTTGIIEGSGELDISSASVAFTNHGTTQPGAALGAGVLTITGGFNQSSSGVLNIEIGGTSVGTGYDRLAVNGAAAIGGTLNITTINGFTPLSSSTFTILTSTDLRSGTFATIHMPDYIFDVTYTSNSIILSNATPVPEPITLGWLVGSAGLALAGYRRRSGADAAHAA